MPKLKEAKTKFGIHNPSWLYGNNPHEMFEDIKAKAQWAEQHGFAWFSVMDHMIQIQGVGAPEEPFMEGWTVLSALAAVTTKIRLATLVSSVAYRNPALLAKMAAGVDIISRGRLTFGIGAGWYVDEYKQYNWVFPEKPAIRIGQLEEAIRLVKTMWTEPRATFHGKYFTVDNAILEPKPVQKPHPPILIGGSGEQLTLRASVMRATSLATLQPSSKNSMCCAAIATTSNAITTKSKRRTRPRSSSRPTKPR